MKGVNRLGELFLMIPSARAGMATLRLAVAGAGDRVRGGHRRLPVGCQYRGCQLLL